jgi:hypothetical protein
MVRRRSTVRFRKGARRSEACSHAKPQTCFPVGATRGAVSGHPGTFSRWRKRCARFRKRGDRADVADPTPADRLGTLGARAALGDHQRADRLHRAVAALRRAGGAPGLRGPCGADGIEGIGLARPAPVLPVGTAGLNNPDTRGCHVPGQASAVTARPFDPDQAHRPRTRPATSAAGHNQPRWGNSCTPSNPPTGSRAAATCVSARVSTPPVTARVSTMVTSSLSEVGGWHAPAGRPDL